MTVVSAMRFRAAGRPTIVYDEYGDASATPVVLLHGGAAGNRNVWGEIPRRLASTHRVLAIDMRGHGSSDRTSGEYGIEHYAGDVEAFIEQVVRCPAVLVGHSWGGLVAAQVAGRRPDLVAAAFFEDAPLHWKGVRPANGGRAFDPQAFREKVRDLHDGGATGVELSLAALQEWMETGEFFPPRQLLWLELRDRGATVDEMVAGLRDMPSPLGGTAGDMIDDAAARELVTGLLACDPEIFTHPDALGAYDPKRPMTCRVHMLRADPALGPPPIGAAFPPEAVEAFLATHPHATVGFVEGAGHGIHRQMPDLLTDRLQRFLGGLHD